MPRDYEQKQFALMKLLRERDINPAVVQTSPNDRAKYERRRDITVAFSTGWDDAQKWEVSEAQRQGIAVQAMNGLLSGDPDLQLFGDDTLHFSKYCYSVADSMMKAAKEGLSEPPPTTADVRRTRYSKQINKLMKAIQYAIDNRGSTFNYDTWIDLCRDGGMDGKATAEGGGR